MFHIDTVGSNKLEHRCRMTHAFFLLSLVWGCRRVMLHVSGFYNVATIVGLANF